MGYTLQQLIDQYRNDADSSFLKLQHQVRLRRERMLTRISREHGGSELRDIRTRTLIAWHREWVSDGKLSMAKALIDILRVLFRFGASILEDQECGRLSDALQEVRLQNSTSRSANHIGARPRDPCRRARPFWLALSRARTSSTVRVAAWAKGRDWRMGTLERARRV
jgi:hypothetical protein